MISFVILKAFSGWDLPGEMNYLGVDRLHKARKEQMQTGHFANKRKLLLLALVGIVSACTANQPVTDSQISSLQTYYRTWRGTPYRMGGVSARGLDCSAFVQNAYREVYQLSLPRDTRQQGKLGKRVSKAQLLQGDLVFFKTGWRQRHVGIYTGDDHFIHVSPSKGVMESSLEDAYWKKRYWKARRLM